MHVQCLVLRADYGFGQFKGKGNDSHKMGNRKKRKGRR